MKADLVKDGGDGDTQQRQGGKYEKEREMCAPLR